MKEVGKRGKGMDTIFLKYHSSGNDYLVYDTGRNDMMLDGKAARTICARNFALGAAGILAGTLVDGQRVEMTMYLPDGSTSRAGVDEMHIFSRYLKDAGYQEDESLVLCDPEETIPESVEEPDGQPEAAQVGKLYLSEEFIARNHMRTALAVH